MTKYQNLLSGNDRTINREVFVHFERRQRDIMEFFVRSIIPNGQSIFMAKQTDKGIKDFVEKNDNHSYEIIEYGSNKQRVPDKKAQSTDWINYFSSIGYAELPDSLREGEFIKGVYEIFSYELFPLRLQYHKENEESKELVQIFETNKKFLKMKISLLNYDAMMAFVREEINLVNNPSDLDELKKDFKHDIFNSFEEFRDAVHYLFDFYSHLCEKIAEYEETREEKSRKEKWGMVFRGVAYKERSSFYNNETAKSETFWDALEDLRLSEYFSVIAKEFENDKNRSDEFFKAFAQSGARGLIQEFHWYESVDCNSFIVPFVNGLVEIANSFPSCIQKLGRITDVDEIDGILDALVPERYESFKMNLFSEKKEEKLHYDVKYSYYKTSFDFIENALNTIKAKAAGFKRKGDDLKNTPVASAYVLYHILTDDNLYPKAISVRAIKKYKSDYLNYYLLCNFIKAVTPYFEERTEDIVSEVVQGILDYDFYHFEEYRKKRVENGFDYLLRQEFNRNFAGSSDTFVCTSHNPSVRYPDYFWYSEQKDDRVLKQFYNNFFMARLEYYKFSKDQKSTSLENVIKYYEKAFQFVYHGGSELDSLISDVFKIYKPIRESQRLYNERKERLDSAKEYLKSEHSDARLYYEKDVERIEKLYEDSIKWANGRYGFDISDSKVRAVSTVPLKHIWQWAAAAGLVNRSYEHINPHRRTIGGIGMWDENRFGYAITNPKVLENFENFIRDLESDADL